VAGDGFSDTRVKMCVRVGELENRVYFRQEYARRNLSSRGFNAKGARAALRVFLDKFLNTLEPP